MSEHDIPLSAVRNGLDLRNTLRSHIQKDLKFNLINFAATLARLRESGLLGAEEARELAAMMRKAADFAPKGEQEDIEFCYETAAELLEEPVALPKVFTGELINQEEPGVLNLLKTKVLRTFRERFRR